MTRVSILACVLVAAPAGTVRGRLTNAQDEPPAIRVNVNLIQLPLMVMNRSGHPVSGLGKQNFQLFVDGAPRPITMFHTDDAPVTAGILVDNSASMTAKGSQVLAAALAFARESNPQDQMFVVHFSDQIKLGLPPENPFTGSISELETALSRFNASGTTSLYDAIDLALTQLRKSPLDRKVLLIISDGGDNSSKVHLPEILKLVQKAGVILYCIGIYDDADRDRNPRVLSELGEISGGKAFFPSELKDVTKTCVNIAQDIRRQYTLGFQGDDDGKYHAIRVVAKDTTNGDLEIRTRSGYFAPAPQSGHTDATHS